MLVIIVFNIEASRKIPRSEGGGYAPQLLKKIIRPHLLFKQKVNGRAKSREVLTEDDALIVLV